MASQLDKKTLIHAGVELVVIGGLVFWVHKKTSDLQAKIDALESKLSEYDEIIRNQSKIIGMHEQFFRSMAGAPVPPQPRSKNPGAAVHTPVHTQSRVVEEDIPDSELDALLADEISTLDAEDVDGCDDGVCLLVPEAES